MHKNLKSLFLTTVFITSLFTAPISKASGISADQLSSLAGTVQGILRSGAGLSSGSASDIGLSTDPAGNVFITAIDSSFNIIRYADGTIKKKQLTDAQQIELANAVAGYGMAFGLFSLSGIITEIHTKASTYLPQYNVFKSKVDLLEQKITDAKAGLTGLTGTDLSDLQAKIAAAEAKLTTAKANEALVEAQFKIIDEAAGYNPKSRKRSLTTPSKRTVASTALINDLTSIMSAVDSAYRAFPSYLRLMSSVTTGLIPKLKPLKDIIDKIRALARSTAPAPGTLPPPPPSSSGGSSSGGSGLPSHPSTHTPVTATPISPHELAMIMKKLLATPKIGVVYKNIIHNQISLNNQLMQRRGMAIQGLWFNGSIPLSNNKLKSMSGHYTDKDLNFSMGFDHLVAKKYLVGGFVKFADNNNNSQNQKVSFKQKQTSYSVGVYAFGKLNNHVYLGDKFSYNMNHFDNKDSEIYPYLGIAHKMSKVDLDGFGNELYIGYKVDRNVLIEGYINSFYTQASNFVQETHTKVTSPTPTITHTLTALGKIDNNIYNAFGIRGFWHKKKSLSETLNVLPFINAYTELPFSGDQLKGSYAHPNMPIKSDYKTSFDDLSSINYGLRLGTTIAGLGNEYLITTIAYNLNHISSTTHSLDLSLSLKL